MDEILSFFCWPCKINFPPIPWHISHLWNFSVHDFVYKTIKRVLRRVARRSAHRNSRVQTCPLVPTLNSSAAYSQDSKLIHKTWKEPTAEYPCVHTQYVNWGQSLNTLYFWMAHPLFQHFNFLPIQIQVQFLDLIYDVTRKIAELIQLHWKLD